MNAPLAIASPLPAPHKSPNSHPKRPKSYTQAALLQDKLADAVSLCRDDMDGCDDREVRARIGSALASMVRGWDILEERKRILRGRPLPGHLRPDLPAAQRKPTKRVALLAEPLEDRLDKESLSAFGPVGAPSPGGGS